MRLYSLGGAVSAAVLAAWAGPSAAAALFSTTAQTNSYNSISFNSPDSAAGAASAQASSQSNDANATSDLKASALASAQVAGGAVKAYAGTTANISGPGTAYSVATATGALNDVFTIACGGCTFGSGGTLTFAVRLDGDLAGSGDLTLGGPPGYAAGNWSGRGEWQFNVSLNTTYPPGNFGYGNVGLTKSGSVSIDSANGRYASGDSFGVYSLTVPVVFGGNNFLHMYGLASSRSDVGGVIFGDGGTFNAGTSFGADLSHTLAWGGITELRDSNGSLVTDFTARSELSGFDYANAYPSTAAVPEPGVWALMISGFGAAGTMLRRRRALST